MGYKIMRMLKSRVFWLPGLLLVGASGASADFEAEIRPIIEAHCVSCHNPDKLKGDLNIDRFQSQAMAVDSLAIWQRIAKRVESGEMPPSSQPQPTAEEK